MEDHLAERGRVRRHEIAEPHRRRRGDGGIETRLEMRPRERGDGLAALRRRQPIEKLRDRGGIDRVRADEFHETFAGGRHGGLIVSRMGDRQQPRQRRAMMMTTSEISGPTRPRHRIGQRTSCHVPRSDWPPKAEAAHGAPDK